MTIGGGGIDQPHLKGAGAVDASGIASEVVGWRHDPAADSSSLPARGAREVVAASALCEVEPGESSPSDCHDTEVSE